MTIRFDRSIGPTPRGKRILLATDGHCFIDEGHQHATTNRRAHRAHQQAVIAARREQRSSTDRVVTASRGREPFAARAFDEIC